MAKALTIALLTGFLLGAASGLSLAQEDGSKEASLVLMVEEAYLAHRRGDIPQALESYTKLINTYGLTSRERATSYLLRGEAKRDQGDYQGAVDDFTRALNNWKNYPHAHYFRGLAYESMGKLEDAYRDLYRAAELDPQPTEEQKKLGQVAPHTQWEAYAKRLSVLEKKMRQEGLDPDSISPLDPLATTALPE